MRKQLLFAILMMPIVLPAQSLNKPLPDFSATGISGKNWTNKDLLGKVTLINFWYIGCLPCMSEAPYLSALKDSISDKNFQLISFAKNNKDDLETFLTGKSDNKDQTVAILRSAFSLKINYEVIPGCQFGTVTKPAKNDCEYINRTIGITTFPTTLIIDKKGIVRYIKTGFVKSGEIGSDKKLKTDPKTNKYVSELENEIYLLLNE